LCLRFGQALSYKLADESINYFAVGGGSRPPCFTDWAAMGFDSLGTMGLATSASASKIRFIGLLHSFGRTSA